MQSHAHINPQSHDQRSQLRPCDVSGGDATMQPAKLVLHRSGLAWPIMFDLIYIDVICYKLYIYMCVWRTHGRSTSADRLVTFVQVPF